MFTGKTVVVTGGSRGIGKAIVDAMAEQGANVIFTYNTNADAASTLVQDLESRYPEQSFTSVQCDISDESQVDRLYDDHLDDLDSVDVLVNNAGVTDDGLMMMMKREQWTRVIQTNLTGPFYITQKLVFKMLKQKHGSIVNISSVAGVYGNAGQCNYAASKSGLIGMSKSLSKELAARHIRVNVVAPGFIDTDMTSDMSESEHQSVIDKIGMKKMGQSSDIADAVCFLASDKSRYITGQTLIVDGGLIL